MVIPLITHLSVLLLIHFWLFVLKWSILTQTIIYGPFCLFTTYFNNYNNVSICGMDESVIHVGRPYGGCTILYKSSCTEIYPYIWVIQRGLVESNGN